MSLTEVASNSKVLGTDDRIIEPDDVGEPVSVEVVDQDPSLEEAEDSRTGTELVHPGPAQWAAYLFHQPPELLAQ